MKKALTIEELRSRIGKPIFVIATTEEFKNETRWYILSKINEFKADNKNRGYIEFTDCNCVNFKSKHLFRFFDTEVTEKELAEILDAEEKEKKTGYERVEKGKDYYTITSAKDVAGMREYGSFNANNEKRYKNGNHFNDETLCENIARAETLKYQLRRYAALNGGIPSKEDWADCEIFKYFVVCNYIKNEIYATYISTQRDSFQIYFKDIKACKKAIEIFKKELIWYFTELEEQLY